MIVYPRTMYERYKCEGVDEGERGRAKSGRRSKRVHEEGQVPEVIY